MPLQPVSSWGRQTRRYIDMLCTNYLKRLGTSEKLIEEREKVSIHWRKPLHITEINQMADTPDVRARRGRP